MISLTDILNIKGYIHLIGIGGIGMSGIAEYLCGIGINVSGSDIANSFIIERLKKLGVKINIGHNAGNIPENTELIIYTSAVKENNPEFAEAKNREIKTVKRAEMLGAIVNDKHLISVSGTHGKTSTTAMIAKILIDNKFDPTVFVGGNVDFLEGGSSRIGKSEYAVVEADEYDRSFHTLKSKQIVITNIEKDHTDIYGSLEDVMNSFNKFCLNSVSGCSLIACGDDKNVVKLCGELEISDIKFYGFSDKNKYKISVISANSKTSVFNINGSSEIKLQVPGKHNILDASAAYLVCVMLGVDKRNIVKSLSEFSPVDRRLQLKYENEISVFDDYAHHPTEVRCSLESLKNSKGRLITIFQPHTYTRTRDFYKEFAESLSLSDIVILTKIYPARETEIKNVNSNLIFGQLTQRNIESYLCEEFSEVIPLLNKVVQKNDIVLFQGAGSITELCENYISQLKVKIN